MTRPDHLSAVVWYRGVPIFRNYAAAERPSRLRWSARIDVPGGGESLAADTLAGMRQLINERIGAR